MQFRVQHLGLTHDVILWALKGLESPTSPVLPYRVHSACSIRGWLQSTRVTEYCVCPMVLASTVSWGLYWNRGCTSPMTSSGLSSVTPTMLQFLLNSHKARKQITPEWILPNGKILWGQETLIAEPVLTLSINLKIHLQSSALPFFPPILLAPGPQP